LSTIPPDVTIYSAKLVLHSYSLLYGENDEDVLCYKSTDISLNENSITWENRPSYSGESVKCNVFTQEAEWHIDWEYSNDPQFIKNSISSGKITLVLLDDISTDEYPYVDFNSREAYNSPELEIRYSEN